MLAHMTSSENRSISRMLPGCTSKWAFCRSESETSDLKFQGPRQVWRTLRRRVTIRPVTDLTAHVERNIRSRKLLRDRQPVLVGVSGGLDSMVLLHALNDLAARYGWRLTVAHFNHRLRGPSSDADERLVRRTAERLKLGFVSGKGDVRGLARLRKLSVELAARELRHDFFAREAQRLGIS